MGRPRQQTFAEAIDGLRAAFTPQQVDTTDLWAVCERKRIELEEPDPC